jgi:hypothetical protein
MKRSLRRAPAPTGRSESKNAAILAPLALSLIGNAIAATF